MATIISDQASAHSLPAPKVSPYSSDKITVIGLFMTLIVVFHHGFNIGLAEGDPHPVLRWAENIVHFGLRGLAVPFFFIVSAYFLCSRPLGGRSHVVEVRKRARSLLMPFLLWSGVWLAIMILLQAIPALAPHFGRDHIVISDPLQLLRLMTLDPIPHPLWYMRDLFLLTLLSPLIVQIVTLTPAAIVYLGGSFWLWCAFPSLALREGQDLFFFGVGAWLAVHRTRVGTPRLGVTLGLLVASLGFFIGNCLWVDGHHAEQPVLFNAGIMLGLPATWFLVDHLRKWVVTPSLVRASRYTLFIYLAHEPLQTILRKGLLNQIGGRTPALTVVWLGVGSVVVLMLVATASILQRWFPTLYGILVGGRMPRPTTTRPIATAA